MADGVPMRSDKGKEILAHAMSKEHCVLEFKEQPDGSMRIIDVTDHFEAMESLLENGE